MLNPNKFVPDTAFQNQFPWEEVRPLIPEQVMTLIRKMSRTITKPPPPSLTKAIITIKIMKGYSRDRQSGR